MAKSAFHIAYKSIDDQTAIATTQIAVGRFVDYTGAQISNASTVIRGIAGNDAVVGQAFRVAVLGTHPVEVGATVAVGAALTTDAQGRAVTATTGQPIFGRALQAATAAGEFIEVFITREGKA